MYFTTFEGISLYNIKFDFYILEFDYENGIFHVLKKIKESKT